MSASAYRILDRRGAVVANGLTCAPGTFFEGVSRSAKEGGHNFPNAAVDTHKLLPTSTWKQLLSAGRFLFANVPILRGAILEQANFSLPLSLHYAGQDKDWGKLAEEYLYERQRNSNVKGPLYTSSVVQRLRLIGRKVDGDIGTLLIDDKSGFSKTQLIRAHRIGDRGSFGSELKTGRFKGKRCFNGTILNDWGAPIGYQILGDTADLDEWVSANDLILTYRPDYADFYRGVSELVACVKSFADIKRLREYEMRAQQMFASIALLEQNETGYADEGSEIYNEGNGSTRAEGQTGILTEVYEDGLVKYFRAKSGAGLEAFRSDRPSTDAQSWEKQFIRQAFYGIEWDPDFALCLEQPGGAWVRAKMQKIHRAIANNVEIERWAQEVEAGFHVAKGIEYGLLPAPKDGNWHSWNAYLSIPLPTADSGNEEAAAREAYKLGLITKQQLIAQRGGWIDEVQEQRKAELKQLAEDARELNALFPEVSVKEWMFWLEQREANSKAETKPASGDPDKTDKPDPTKEEEEP